MCSNYLDKNAILGSLTDDDIIKIVCDLGSEKPRKDSHGNLIFQTICHNTPSSSNSYKLYYYQPNKEEKYGRFYCYTGEHDSIDIIELVMRARRTQGITITWYQALRYIASFTNHMCYKDEDIKTTEAVTVADLAWLERIKSSKSHFHEIPEFEPINESVLQTFCYVPHEEWLNDSISREAMGRYEISYYGLNNSIIIPHRDKKDQLIGIRQRFLDKADIENLGKYMPLQINGKFLAHSLGNNLYGINVVQDRVKACKKCLLVESEKSCMQTYSYFGDDAFAVAVCGSHISPVQVQLLTQYLGCEEVLVGFDKEYSDPHSFEAEAYYHKLVKEVAPLVMRTKVSLIVDSDDNLLHQKDSPTDRGKDTLLKLIDNKVPISLDEVNRIMELERKNNES